MDKLKQLFPLSFRGAELKDMIISIILYIVAEALVGVVFFILALIPIINVIVAIVGSIVSSLLGIYVLVGIVLAVLNYLKVLK